MSISARWLRSTKTTANRATLTAVVPPGRFGALELASDQIERFAEKPGGDGGFINGGFFVLHPSVGDLLDDDGAIWERAPLETLAAEGDLMAFRHKGFWQPMDTLRDRRQLEERWQEGNAPWEGLGMDAGFRSENYPAWQSGLYWPGRGCGPAEVLSQRQPDRP